MTSPTDDNRQVDCYLNKGRRRIPLDEAHRLFWKYPYAWLLPVDWYRWNVERHSGAEFVCEKVKPAARSFGLHVHTRGMRALTVVDLENIESGRIDIRTFQGRAARFNKIFGDLPSNLRPFFYYEIDSPRQLRASAYRMHPNRPWIVVVGLKDGSGLQGEHPDWSLFLEPP